MIRNLKILGLALVAMLSMAAVGASAASAAEGHCHTTGTNCFVESNSTASDNEFVVPTGVTKCSTINLSGTAPKTFSTVTINVAEYLNCKIFGVKATVAMNGCHFLLHISGSMSPYVTTTDIVCPAGKSVTATPLGIACVLTYGAQTGLEGITLTNTGGPSTETLYLLAHINITTIKYTETGAECVSPGTRSTGVLKGTLTIKAFEDNAGVTGAQRGLTVT